MYRLNKAYLEITNVCNLTCPFCPGTRREKGFLSPVDFRLLAGRIRPHTRYLYLHLMGEPLLHPHLAQLLEIGAELDFSLMITTNGTLLPRQEPLLLASPAVEKVSVSLHSFSQGHRGPDRRSIWTTLFPLRSTLLRPGGGAPCGCGTWHSSLIRLSQRSMTW